MIAHEEMTQTRLTIRAMGSADLDAVIPLLYEFQKDTAYRDAPPTDATVLRSILDIMLERSQYYGCFLAVEDDHVIGFCFGSIGPAHLFLPRVMLASESAWWVKPEYRSGSIGAKLLAAFRQWGIERRASVLSYGRPLTSRKVQDGVYREEIVRRTLGDTHVR